jgi:hypothetical protein
VCWLSSGRSSADGAGTLPPVRTTPDPVDVGGTPDPLRSWRGRSRGRRRARRRA